MPLIDFILTSIISKDLGTVEVIYYLLVLTSAFNGTLNRAFLSSMVESIILAYYKNLLCMAASIYVLS